MEIIKMRYLFFSYVFNSKYGASGNGNVAVKNDIFPSINQVLDEIVIANINAEKHSIAITGWQEFKSKADYDNFFNC